MHPYQNVPARSFWSRSVSSGFDVHQLTDHDGPLIRPGETVASAGSCFASNLVPFLERAGFEYLWAERRNPAFSNVRPENLGYENFSAAYGNIYTPRQLLQLLRRCLGSFNPAEDRWHTDAGVVDPFRPGLRYHALTDREFDLLSAQHLRAVRRVFEEAKVFIFTLGLTEAWVSRLDGAVFPACPGTIGGTFDEALHGFVNFSVQEVISDLDAFVTELRVLNRGVRIILTVSPVPLVATATGKHVLPSSTYSKAVLRVSAEEMVGRHASVCYFPAFEIVTGPQAPDAYLEADRRSVTQEAIAAVMTAFLSACEAPDQAPPVENESRGQGDSVRLLSRMLSEAECEEAMADIVTKPFGPSTPSSPPRTVHQVPRLILAGHCHLSAIAPDIWCGPAEEVIAAPGRDSTLIMAGPWPREETYWDALADLGNGSNVGILWGGAEHNHCYFFETETRFDFLSTHVSKVDASAQMVSQAIIRDRFQQQTHNNLDLVLERLATGGLNRIALIGTPPPKGDNEALRALLKNERWLVNKAAELGRSMETIPITDPYVRLKLWYLLQDMLADVAHIRGLMFIPVPKEVQDADGFLKREFWASDVTHANVAYGNVIYETVVGAFSNAASEYDFGVSIRQGAGMEQLFRRSQHG